MSIQVINLRQQRLFRVLELLVFLIALDRCVYINAQRERFDVFENSEAPNRRGVVLITEKLESSPRELDLLVLDIQNQGSEPLQIQAELNRQSYGEIAVAPGQKKRTFLQLPQKTLAARRFFLRLEGRGNWILKQCELRNNFYGFSNRYLVGILGTSEFADYLPVPPWGLVLAGLFFIVLSTHLQHRSWAGIGLRIFLLLLLTACTALPLVTRYKVLFTVLTFSKLLLLYYFTALAHLFVKLRSRLSPRARTATAAVMVGAAVFVFFLLLLKARLPEYSGNLSGFLQLGTRYSRNNFLLDRSPGLREQLITQPRTGYDGQFYYYAAFDPLLTSERPFADYLKIFDMPAYRYGRILYPFLTYAVSFGNPARFPGVMLGLLLFSCALGAGVLALMIAANKQTPAWALLFACIPSFTIALYCAVPESLSALLLLLAIFMHTKHRYSATAALLALAILTRDTSALVAGTLTLLHAYRREWRAALLTGSSVLPYILWRGFVHLRLGHLSTEGGVGGSHNLGLPLKGMIDAIQATGSATVVALGILLLLALGVSVYAWRKGAGAPAYIALIYLTLAILLNYQYVWVAAENVERVTYECFLFLLLSVFAIPDRRRAKFAAAFTGSALLVYCSVFMSHAIHFRWPFLWLLEVL